MFRVADALAEFAPAEIEIVPVEEWADLVVLHVIGYPETAEAIARLEAEGKRYAILQYCLRSTQRPSSKEWCEFWKSAATVWSYYDLDQALRDDQLSPSYLPRGFYYAPLGADHRFFYPRLEVGERFVIMTSGYVAESETVAEATEAAARAGRQVFHLGPSLDCHGPHVTQRMNIGDNELARLYSRCDYVAALRRCEGFEMPGAEGLLCGAQPICFDRPHYRAWYEPWAEFIPEADGPEVTDALEALFRRPARAFADVELAAARKRFDWQVLVEGFWQRILKGA
jgi:hypothetical protein